MNPRRHCGKLAQRLLRETAAVDRTTQEFRGDISIEPERLKGWRLSLGVIEIFPEDQDCGDGLDLTLGKGDFRIGYRAQREYRGETDGEAEMPDHGLCLDCHGE